MKRARRCNEYFLSILNIVNDYYFMMSNAKNVAHKIKYYKDCVDFITNEAEIFVKYGYDIHEVELVRDEQLEHVRKHAKMIGLT